MQSASGSTIVAVLLALCAVLPALCAVLLYLSIGVFALLPQEVEVCRDVNGEIQEWVVGLG